MKNENFIVCCFSIINQGWEFALCFSWKLLFFLKKRVIRTFALFKRANRSFALFVKSDSLSLPFEKSNKNESLLSLFRKELQARITPIALYLSNKSKRAKEQKREFPTLLLTYFNFSLDLCEGTQWLHIWLCYSGRE